MNNVLKKVGTIFLVAAMLTGGGVATGGFVDGAGSSVTVNAAGSSQDAIAVTSITLNKTKATVYKGKTMQLKATVNPSKASDKSVTWSTSNKNVATVDENGLVKGISSGTATIKATSSNGKVAKCTVTVKRVVASSVTLDKTAATVYKGKTVQLKATVNPSNAVSTAVTWSTSNKNIATVDKNGLVKGVGCGNATITATSHNGKTARCAINVKNSTVDVSYITLNKTSANIYKGKTVQLSATINPSNASNKSITWSTSNKNVATVDKNGLVKGVGYGSTIITATSNNGKTARCAINVKNSTVDVSYITLNKTSANIYKGKTVQLSATINPSNASNKSITWSTSNKNVATVDKNGLVKGVGYGSATITATSHNGKTAKCTINVKNSTVDVSFITLDKPSANIYKGKTVQLSATINPSNASNKSITWSTSNKNVATVDKNGLVKGVGYGSTIITATSNNGKTARCAINVKNSTVDVSYITLNKTSANIYKGKTVQLSATINPSNASNKSITWSTSNKNVATVDKNGLVKGVGYGSTIITATSNNGKTARCAINVTQVSVSAITLDKSSVKINSGKTVQLKATISPSNASNKSITWSTSNKNVATVDKNGLVKGISYGTAVITARSSNYKTAQCTVSVDGSTINIVEVSAIQLNRTSLILSKGGSSTMTAMIAPYNASDQSVKWSTNNSKVATVDKNGVVKGVNYGTATITATSSNGKTAKCMVTVKKVEVSTVTLDKYSANVNVGKTIQLKAIINPSNADNKSVTWSTSNKSIATVDKNGLVKGISSGTVTITATSNNGKTAKCTVTVKK